MLLPVARWNHLVGCAWQVAELPLQGYMRRLDPSLLWDLRDADLSAVSAETEASAIGHPVGRRRKVFELVRHIAEPTVVWSRAQAAAEAVCERERRQKGAKGKACNALGGGSPQAKM